MASVDRVCRSCILACLVTPCRYTQFGMASQIPPKVEYSLTEFGKTLEPILLTLLKWGEEYTNQIIERKLAVQTQAS
jgi:HxlR-like helix-turn-helix